MDKLNRNLNLLRIKNYPKILETKRNNIHLEFNRIRESVVNEFNAPQNEFVEYVMKSNYYANPFLNESEEFVPRFSLKKYAHPIFSKLEPNKEYPFNQDLVEKAIEYGMALLIQYRGAEDDFTMGHSRVIYPMVIGRSAAGKLLLRGYHLKGWSVSQKGNIDKEWRMFRCDRIISMSFSGTFFRLPPEGYNMKDKGMKGGIIKAADFGQIRRNQLTLVQKQVIQRKSEIDLDQGQGDNKAIPVVQVEDTSTILDLRKPFDNVNIDEKSKALIRITFLKSNYKSHYIAVLGAYGKKGNQVRLVTKGKVLGTYTVMRAILGHHLGKSFYNNIDGKTEFELNLFIKIVAGNGPQPQNETPDKKVEDKKEADKEKEEEKKDVAKPEKDLYDIGDTIEWDLTKDKDKNKPEEEEDKNKPKDNTSPESNSDDIYSPES